MVKVIVAKSKLDCSELLGKFLDERHYDTLIEEDCDVYGPPDCDMDTQAGCDVPCECETCPNGLNEKRIILKFRKNWFSEKEQKDAYDGLREAAIITENRGIASGIKENMSTTDDTRPWVTHYESEMCDALIKNRNASIAGYDEDVIDMIQAKYPTKESRKVAGGAGKHNVWVISRFPESGFVFDEWIDSIKPLSKEERADSAQDVTEMMSTTTYGAGVYSGIAGWFDRYPRIPYGRATGYTKNNWDKFKLSFPFLQTLAKGFKELLPWRYANQMECAKKLDSRFLVPKTPFTTITVNKTFRTAAHYDAGDLSTGLSNLLVLSNDGRFSGGYLIAPEYRIAVNVRPGDLLLINNHEVMHGNTPIVCEEGSERVSLVCYFREKMLELGSKEYEDCRFNFVEHRRLNKSHPMQRKLWNGISPGMWESEEWYEYLESNLGRQELLKHHPKAEKSSLEDFF